MKQTKQTGITLFYSYASTDSTWRDQLSVHLSQLKRDGLIEEWSDQQMLAGSDRVQALDQAIRSAQIILLLISADFLASDACYHIELQRALERHKRGEAHVIPIFVRPCDWQHSPFAHLPYLPRNAKPITTWDNQDEAFASVAASIRRAIEAQPLQLEGRSVEETQYVSTSEQEFASGEERESPRFPSPPQKIHSPQGIVRLDWGEAPDVPIFFGRTKELILLEQWLTRDRCRLVALVGMGGIGKTRLSVKLGRGGIGKTDLSLKLAQGIEAQFDYVIWRRLLNAPTVSEILTDLIKFLSNQQEVTLPDAISEQILRLLHYLRKSRCLVILDNVEMILQGGKDIGQYSPGYEEYGQLFEQIAEIPHQSCLLLTSREKPPDIARRESKTGPVRSLEVRGLNVADSKKIFAEIGSFLGSKEDWKQLNALYNGNPLALELAARHIKEVFFGSISEFLRKGKPIFADLQSLLDWHFNRLSDSHKEVMYWFAINREPTSLSELKEDIVSPGAKEQIPSTLQVLQRLLPLERSTTRFTLQPVLIEYMTARLVEQSVEEIRTRNIELLNTHALLKTLVKDYIRESQSRLILKPINGRLLTIFGSQTSLEAKFKYILSILQKDFPLKPGYAGGNVLNLLCQLQADLTNYDFSCLTIWQAYLRGVTLPKVNFAHANLMKSVFTETFGSVLSVAFSPNGDLLAAGTFNGEVRLWSTATSAPVLVCEGHTNSVWSVAFSPDGNIIASGSEDQTVRLWQVSTGRCLKTIQGHIGRVWAIAFSPDGKNLAIGSEEQSVHLCVWEISSSQHREILQSHTDRICSVAFSPDGKTLASGSEDQTIRLWEVGTGEHLKTLQGHVDRVPSVAFSPDGRLLASGSLDRTVRLWQVDTGQCLKILQGHTDWVHSVAFSPDGNVVASGSGDVRLWEISTGQCLKILQGHTILVRAVAFSPDGRTIVSGSYDQTLRLWEANTGHCLHTLQGYVNPVYSVVFSPDGKAVASSSEDRTVRLWEINTGQCLKILQGHTSLIRAVAFSPDGRLLASGSEDRTVRLWQVSTGQCLKILDHADWLRSVVFSPDGKTLASGSEDRTVRLWQVSTGQCLKILQGHTDRAWSVTFSPSGDLLASSSDDGMVRLWQVSTGQCLKILQGHADWVRAVAFSPDGRLLASGSADRTVRLWQVSTGQYNILRGHTDGIHSVAFSPDGNMVASGSNDGTLRLWQVSTGQRLKILQGHTGMLRSVAFSPRGDIVASSSDDGTVKLWNIQTGMCLQTLRSNRPYEGMNITQVKGLTATQTATLKSLGAIENE